MKSNPNAKATSNQQAARNTGPSQQGQATSSAQQKPTSQNMKFTDPKHVPKDLKDSFLKKIQFCS